MEEEEGEVEEEEEEERRWRRDRGNRKVKESFILRTKSYVHKGHYGANDFCPYFSGQIIH